jgi:hypothetical protein
MTRTNAYPPAISRSLTRAGFPRAVMKDGLPTKTGFEVTKGGGGEVVVRWRSVLSGQVTAHQAAMTHYLEYLRIAGFEAEAVSDGGDPPTVTMVHVWKKS